MQSCSNTLLPPCTPSELLHYVVAQCRYPTTLVIGWSRQEFLNALIEDVGHQVAADGSPDEEDPSVVPGSLHPLLRRTLLQTAVSRQIRLVFAPAVTHLRAWTATLVSLNSRVQAPPNHTKPSSVVAGAPLLLVYGFLELHRGTSEWSAQGLGTSLAIIVEAAARTSLKATIVEPRGSCGYNKLREFISEKIPLLNGTSPKDDGTWPGRTIEVSRVLLRWFTWEEEYADSE